MAHGLPSGTLIYHNQYRIEKMLGQGGFGITYLAYDLFLDRKVAIKQFFPRDYIDMGNDNEATCFSTTVFNNSDYVKRIKYQFLNEARHIARLDHFNIIKIFSAFEEMDTIFYVMEYIEGESLLEKVKREGPIQEKDAKRIIREVGLALDYMHQQKFNHLDVKPGNIMIRKLDNAPILIDFGLSTHYISNDDTPTEAMPPCLTSGFSPIELYDSTRVRNFTPQSDVYSLAATLYFIVSGVIPKNAVHLSNNILPFPSNFPKDLEDPIKKGMANSKSERFISVKSFLESLENKNCSSFIRNKNIYLWGIIFLLSSVVVTEGVMLIERSHYSIIDSIVNKDSVSTINHIYNDHGLPKLREAYNMLIEDGYTPPVYYTFIDDMRHEPNLKEVYNTLKEENHSLPIYDSFKHEILNGEKEIPRDASKITREDDVEWLYHKLEDAGYNVGQNVAEFDSLILNNDDSMKWCYIKTKELKLNVDWDFYEILFKRDQLKLTNCYLALIGEGYDDIGSNEEFHKSLEEPAFRKKVYDRLVRANYNMQPYSEYESKVLKRLR